MVRDKAGGYTVTFTVRSAFFDRLATGTPILFDGGMGTQLDAQGVPYERCFDELNLRQGDLVQAVNPAYIAAGAEVIETNTFAANRVRLAAYGLAGRVRDINFRGVKIAREAREISGEPVFLAGSVSSIGQPLAPVGTITPEEARAIFIEQIEALLEAGVDLLVLETFSSPLELREAVRAAKSVSADLPIVAQVSVDEDGNTLAGATPRVLVAALDSLRVADSGDGVPEPAVDDASPLARKVRAGEFVISVEVDPPRGINPNKMLQGATLLKSAGVDCVDIGDSPMARVRMSCIAFAALCEQRVGVETLIHFTTRDRNLMALQSELLGAHALGIRNVIALTGDPPQMGSYPSATGVWDVKSPGFIRIIKQLNQGVDWAGNSIGRPTNFLVACAVNPMADDLEYELDWYYQKVDAGADFAITQPLYNMEQLDRFFSRVPHPPIPTVVEIMPLQSYRHAEFCHNELAGVVIPREHLGRMKEAGERGIDVGFQLAHQFLLDVFDRVDGALFVPSFHRYEMVAELVRETVRLRDRARVPVSAGQVGGTPHKI